MRVIRASEIGAYVYCARAWWLQQVAGHEPAGQERRSSGVTLHQRHGTGVALSRWLLGLALLLLLSGTALLLISAG